MDFRNNTKYMTSTRVKKSVKNVILYFGPVFRRCRFIVIISKLPVIAGPAGV